MMMVDEVVNNEVENAEIQLNSIIGYSLSDQHRDQHTVPLPLKLDIIYVRSHILSSIQDITTNFDRFTNIYTNCSEMQNLCTEFQFLSSFFVNLRKSDKISCCILG